MHFALWISLTRSSWHVNAPYSKYECSDSRLHCHHQHNDYRHGIHRPVFPVVWSTAPWGGWNYLWGRYDASGNRCWGGGVVLSEFIFRLCALEVTSDQTSGNWYHFKPIPRLMNLLRVNYLLNVVPCFIVITTLVGCANRCSELQETMGWGYGTKGYWDKNVL